MRIRLITEKRECTATPDPAATVLDLAQRAGVPIVAQCGGEGACGSCTVILGEGRYRLYDEVLTVGPGERREALACQTYVESPEALIIFPPSRAADLENVYLADELVLPKHNSQPLLPGISLDDLSAITNGKIWGLAIDVGTTTVVAALLDLMTGKVLGVESRFNQQILRGEDVISRVAYATDVKKLAHLQSLLMEHTIRPLIASLCAGNGGKATDIVSVVIAGNTIMSHLVAGLSPESIGRAPFKPVARFYGRRKAAEFGLAINRQAVAELLPSIAGYVGGDVVADILVTDLASRPGLTVLVDLGTNGEIVVNNNGEITACATAAGPAFEGGGLSHGMRAGPGAIDSIYIKKDLNISLKTIGDAAPVGICGSAIIDFIAEGLRIGLINELGRLNTTLLKEKGQYELIGGAIHACRLGKSPVLVTEKDIAEIMKAKAAIFAGILTLLRQNGRQPSEIDRLILAGKFARHLNLPNAIAIGLLPNIPIERYEVIGNGSLSGAAVTLLDKANIARARQIADLPRVVELTLDPGFTGYFDDALPLKNHS